MIAAAAQTLDVRDWAVALPLLLVLVGFCAVGVWVITFPDDARRYMDRSQMKHDMWFNRRGSGPTPSSLPRVLGSVLVVFTVGLGVLIVAVAAGSG
ncbi:hypothetical protein [Microcella sp.]|uniref:hypothetical protein n=1 Tax=Microcella sp. TaxID=1913979 RepID=UPI00256C12DD|nr:hypothetical protein [Microcella sp.]MBX9471175.1 hypothetical protein [Microcella sp.]